MPPLDYEALLPVDVDGDSDEASPMIPAKVILAQARKVMIQREYALEFYCLRMLLLHPDLLYGINRKFRELAKDNTHLVKGPLGDLDMDDFQNGDYRAFMQMLKMAIRQDELEIIPFVREQLSPAMVLEFERLFAEESDAARERLRRRFDGDAIISWRQHERRNMGTVDPGIEVLDKALRLRLERLQRDTQEMQFLQMDAHHQDDQTGSEQYVQQIMLAVQAKRLIEAELKQLSRHFV
jgi:hypothetical protein